MHMPTRLNLRMQVPQTFIFNLIFDKRKSTRALKAHIQERCRTAVLKKELNGDARGKRSTESRREEERERERERKSGREGMWSRVRVPA